MGTHLKHRILHNVFKDLLKCVRSGRRSVLVDSSVGEERCAQDPSKPIVRLVSRLDYLSNPTETMNTNPQSSLAIGLTKDEGMEHGTSNRSKKEGRREGRQATQKDGSVRLVAGGRTFDGGRFRSA